MYQLKVPLVPPEQSSLSLMTTNISGIDSSFPSATSSFMAGPVTTVVDDPVTSASLWTGSVSGDCCRWASGISVTLDRANDDCCRWASGISVTLDRVSGDCCRWASGISITLDRVSGDCCRWASGISVTLDRANDDCCRWASGISVTLDRVSGDCCRWASGISVTLDRASGISITLDRASGDCIVLDGDGGDYIALNNIISTNSTSAGAEVFLISAGPVMSVSLCTVPAVVQTWWPRHWHFVCCIGNKGTYVFIQINLSAVISMHNFYTCVRLQFFAENEKYGRVSL